MASLNQPFDIFPILSEDGNFVVDNPSVTAHGNFLVGVARIVDGFFKLPFNATGAALQLCEEIVPVNASLRPKHFLNHVAGLFVQLVMVKIGLTYTASMLFRVASCCRQIRQLQTSSFGTEKTRESNMAVNIFFW